MPQYFLVNTLLCLSYFLLLTKNFIYADSVKVTDEDSAHMARNIAKTEGLFVGYTSGAVMQAILQYAQDGAFDANSKVVAIFPDHGSRYMSKVFSNNWMNEQGFFDSKHTEEAVIEYVK